jgi:carboxyl-terminal processing protease
MNLAARLVPLFALLAAPFCVPLDAQDFRTLQEEALGQFGGLGVQVAMEQGFLKIVRAIPQSRAAKSGLRPGDIILRLNDQPITGLPISQAVARMRGPCHCWSRTKNWSSEPRA